MSLKSLLGGAWNGLTHLGGNGEPDGNTAPEKPAKPVLIRKPFGGLPNPMDKLPEVADAPPPGAPRTASPASPIDHANSLPSTLPSRPAPLDPTKELGDAPIKKLRDLPDVPTRTPLDKSQTTGFKNRLRGAWEGVQNAGLHGGNGLQVIGAAIGGAVNRERSNKGVWEQTVELPEISKRNARTKEIVAAQKGYDESAKEIQDRNDKAEKRYQDDTKNYQWAEDLKQKALEAEAARKAKAAENEALRNSKTMDAATKHKYDLEMRERWEKHNAEQRDLDRQSRMTEQQMREREAMRRERFQADNNLERDFYRYTAESGDGDTEPSEEDIQKMLNDSPETVTREQVVADLKASKAKNPKAKPGAAAAAAKIAKRFGGSWGNVPAGK